MKISTEIKKLFYESGNKVHYTLDKDQVLLLEDQRVKGVYLILEGSFKAVLNDKNQNEVVLWEAQPGEIIGLEDGLIGYSYLYTFISNEPAELIKIDHEELMDFLNSEKSANFDMLNKLSTRITRIERRIGLLSR